MKLSLLRTLVNSSLGNADPSRLPKESISSNPTL